MLEGDELLELAQETGYRLCFNPAQPSEEKHSVFSASWDLNPQFYRLFLCLQNGELKVIDFLESTSLSYQVRFQHHISNISDYQKAQDKLISLHFDKFSTIPGKDSELLFLLGVSKSIMHSKLPDIAAGQAAGSLAWSTYHFGHPILELASHSSRITALSVSFNGKYLASGDETGNVRILLLQTKENMQEVLTSEFNRIQQKKADPSNLIQEVNQIHRNKTKNFLLKYDKTENLHHGPIFAVQWIYPEHITPFNSSNGLLTGSIDRAVRLWNVSYSVMHGISIKPMMVFDTFSTHTLCLHTFSSAAFAEQQLKQQQNSMLRSKNLEQQGQSSKKDFSNDPNHEETISITSSQAMMNLMVHYSYIFAGTNLGTLHIWKVYDNDFVNLYDKNNEVSGLSSPKGKQKKFLSNAAEEKKELEYLLDNGRRLIAVIQVFDTPLIHLSTGNMISSLIHLHNSFNGNLLLSVSDNNGRVKIYGTEYHLDNEEEFSKSHSLNKPKKKITIQTDSNDNIEEQEEDNDDENTELFKLEDSYQIQKIKTNFEKEFRHSYKNYTSKVYQDDYNNSFNNANSSKEETEAIRLLSEHILSHDDEEDRKDPHADQSMDEKFSPYKEEYYDCPIVGNQFSRNIHQKPELAIVTMNGMIRIFNDIMESKTNKAAQLTVSIPFPEPEEKPQPANLRTTPRVAKIDSPEKLKQKLLNSPRKGRSGNEEDEEEDLFHTGGRGGNGDEESYHTKTTYFTRSDKSETEIFMNKEMQQLYEKKLASSERRQKREQLKQQQEKEEMDANNNTIPSSNLEQQQIKSSSRNSSPVKRNEGKSNSKSEKRISIAVPSPSGKSIDGNQSRTGTPGSKRSSILRQSDELEPNPRFQSPPKPIPLTSSNLKQISKQQTENASPNKRVSILAPATSFTTTGHNEKLSRRMSSMSMKSIDLLSEKSETEDEKLFAKYSIEKSEFLNNEFSIPSLQSAKIFEKQIEKKFQNIPDNLQDIKDEDISISTIHTTKSDHLYARQQIQSMKRKPRYPVLTNGYYFDAKDINQVYSSIKPTTPSNYPSRLSIKQMKNQLLNDVLQDKEKDIVETMLTSFQSENLLKDIPMNSFYYSPPSISSTSSSSYPFLSSKGKNENDHHDDHNDPELKEDQEQEQEEEIRQRKNQELDEFEKNKSFHFHLKKKFDYNREFALYSHLPKDQQQHSTALENASYSLEINYFDLFPQNDALQQHERSLLQEMNSFADTKYSQGLMEIIS